MIKRIFNWINQWVDRQLDKAIKEKQELTEEEVRRMTNYIDVCPEMFEHIAQNNTSIRLERGGIVTDGFLFRANPSVPEDKMIVKGHKDQIIRIVNVGTDWKKSK